MRLRRVRPSTFLKWTLTGRMRRLPAMLSGWRVDRFPQGPGSMRLVSTPRSRSEGDAFQPNGGGVAILFTRARWHAADGFLHNGGCVGSFAHRRCVSPSSEMSPHFCVPPTIPTLTPSLYTSLVITDVAL